MSLVLLPTEIILNILDFIYDSSFNNLLNTNRLLKSFESYFFEKSKLIKYKVNYTDPTNFIYVANKQKLENFYKNSSWKYNEIQDLYMKYFEEKEIIFINCSITSFPIYPNMTYCNLQNNKLTTFPIQPKMTGCNLQNNKITTFPTHPEMTGCNLQNNKLTTFPVQPKMTD